MATLAGREQQVVEAVEGDVRGARRPGEPLPRPVRPDPDVVRADDGQPGGLGRTDPLARRLRDVPEREHLVDAVAERQADPVARRLDLLDGAEPGRRMAVEERGIGGRDLRVGGHDVDPAPASASATATWRAASVAPSAADRGRTARHVGAAAADQRPRALESEHATAVVGHEEARPPAGRRPMVGPGARLVDVAAGGVDRRRVPALELGGRVASRAVNRRPRSRRPRSPRRPRGAGGPSGRGP